MGETSVSVRPGRRCRSGRERYGNAHQYCCRPHRSRMAVGANVCNGWKTDISFRPDFDELASSPRQLGREAQSLEAPAG
jgi:hypothetical protein